MGQYLPCWFVILRGLQLNQEHELLSYRLQIYGVVPIYFQMFDLLRKHGSEEVNGYTIEIGGNGAWKHLEVYNGEGEQIIEKKFYKADFHEIVSHPEYGQYVDMLLEKAMIRKNESEDPDIDTESYTDIKAVHDHIMEEHNDAFEMLK